MIGPTMWIVGERGSCERRAFQAFGPFAGVDQHEPSHRADNDRVPECSGGRNERLAHGIFGLCRGGNDRALPRPDSFENRPRATP